MIFEHFAINVTDPHTIAEWYTSHLEMKIVRMQDAAPYTTFLADKTGRVICELYHRPEEKSLNFREDHPLTFHFAMETKNAEAEKIRLISVGATLFEEQHLDDGSHLVMLKDPFGVSLQLCQRGQRMNTISL